MEKSAIQIEIKTENDEKCIQRAIRLPSNMLKKENYVIAARDTTKIQKWTLERINRGTVPYSIRWETSGENHITERESSEVSMNDSEAPTETSSGR